MKNFSIELTEKELALLQVLVAIEIKNDFALYGLINKELINLHAKLKGENNQ